MIFEKRISRKNEIEVDVGRKLVFSVFKMKNPPPLIVPADLDLGDIAGVKVGDELAVIHTHNGGKRELAPKTVFVTEITKDSAGEVIFKNGRSVLFRPKFGGAAYYFMFRGVYFYSANPAHIAEAKEKAEKAERERIARETERKRKMKICLPIGEIFGDGSGYDSDGCYYETQKAAEALAEKLNDEQLKQLAEWLGVKI